MSCSGLHAVCFLRAGEFTVKSADKFDPTSLMLEDVAVDKHDNPALVRIRLKQRKTDPFWHGVDIFLGWTQADVCPVSALLAYIAVCPSVYGPLFVFGDGSFLSRDKLVSTVQAALEHAGMDVKGHSFRIGAATTVAQVGLEDFIVKMLGRWEFTAYQ